MPTAIVLPEVLVTPQDDPAALMSRGTNPGGEAFAPPAPEKESYSVDEVLHGKKPAEPEKESYSVDEVLHGKSDFFPDTEVHSARTGELANYAAGGNTAIAGALGAPVDLAAAGINLAQRGINPVREAFGAAPLAPIEHPIGGSESIKSLMGAGGFDPRQVVPGSDIEKVARAAGEGTVGAVLPYAGARAVAPLLTEAGPTLRAAADALSHGTMRGNAALGAVGGAGGEVAETNAPESVKPIANFAGNLVAGGGASLASAAARGVVGGALDIARNYLGPIALPGQARENFGRVAATARQLQRARDAIVTRLGGEGNVPSARAALGAGDHEFVPGSEPTSFQATGIEGLGELERYTWSRNRAAFLERQNTQNLARSDNLEGLRPENAGSVGAALRGELERIDAEQGGRIGAARGATENAVADMGGHDTAQQYGGRIAGEIHSNYAPSFAEADAALQQQGERTAQAVSDMGGAPETSVQQRGEQLRGRVADAKKERKSEVGSLFDAIPKNLAFDGDALRAAAAKVRGMVDEAAGDELGAREKVLVDRAANFPADATFDTARNFRSNIASAIRDVGGRLGYDSREVRRLQALKNGVENAIVNTVEGKVAQESAAVAAGQMEPEATILARIQANLERQSQGFRERQSTSVSARGGAGEVPAGQSGPAGGSVPGTSRAGVPPGGQPGNDAGAQGVPGGTQPLTPEIAADYKRARSEYLDYKQTFASGATGEVLKAGRGGELYALQNSEVPAKFWNSGKTAAEDVQSFLKAAGHDDTALAALQDYAAFDLRRVAETRDANGLGSGRLDLGKYQAWLAKHQAAIAALPEQIQGPLLERFGTAQRAQATLDDLKTARAALEKAYPLQPGGSNAELAERYFTKGAKGSDAIDAYVRDTGGSPAAMSNLADYVASRLRAEAVNPDQTVNLKKLDAFKRDYGPALSRLPPEQVAKFDTVAAAQRTLDEAMQQRTDAVRSFEKSAAAHYLGERDPIKAIGSALASANPTAAIAELTRMVSHDPAALNGLRRDFMDLAMRRTRTNQPIGGEGVLSEGLESTTPSTFKPDAFQNFVKDNAGPLRVLFGEDGLQRFRAVAADLRRTNLSITGSKLPGQPNTAQDLMQHATALNAKDYSVIGTVLAAELGAGVGEGLGYLASGPGPGMIFAGAAASAGYAMMQVFRHAGLQTVDQILTEAALHPKLMDALLARPPKTPDAPSAQRLGSQISALALSAAVNAPNRRPAVVPQSRSSFLSY